MKLACLFLLFTISVFGQKIEEVEFAKEDPYNLYHTRDEDSTRLFYKLYIPTVKPVGALVILPGAGEPVEYVEQQITLQTLAVEKGLLVIFPSINWGISTHVPEHEMLNAIFLQVIERFGIPADKFVLGGFSGGAMLSLSYAQKANREPGSTTIIPKAVFGVDPPLDYAHLWHHCIRDLQRNFSQVAMNEANWILGQYRAEFGGSPEEFPANYIKYSIYSHSQKDGGNAKYLLTTPMLLYTEPDVLWSMENRHRDFYDLNAMDISAMVNLLQLGGNKEAKMIITEGKGVRPDGRRHPHSWSIMDSRECLDWIMVHLK